MVAMRKMEKVEGREVGPWEQQRKSKGYRSVTFQKSLKKLGEQWPRQPFFFPEGGVLNLAVNVQNIGNVIKWKQKIGVTTPRLIPNILDFSQLNSSTK